MIRINLNSARTKLTIEGHAQPEESAQYKEICAAASALVQALAYSITKFNHEGDALELFKFDDTPGNVLLKVKASEWSERAITRRFNEYGDGFELLALSHPYSVEMIWDGEKILPEMKEEGKHE